jgi:HNH endonuclease
MAKFMITKNYLIILSYLTIFKRLFKEFMDNVKKTDSCWLWLGGKTGQGYGAFSPARELYFVAHKFSFEYHNTCKIKGGYEIMHSCDNPVCVNPKHLKEVTHAENMHDKYTKGRSGLLCHGLTHSDAEEMKKLKADGVTIVKIAAHYKVEYGVAKYIIAGKAKYLNP